MNFGGITTIYGVCAFALFFYFRKATGNGHRIFQAILVLILVVAIAIPFVWPVVREGASQASANTDKSLKTVPSSPSQTKNSDEDSRNSSPVVPNNSGKNAKAANLLKNNRSARSTRPDLANGNENPQLSSPSQICPNGICIGGNNYGNPTVINQGPAPVTIALAQADAITRAMTSYDQRHVEISTSGITEETVSAGLQLQSALEKAGLVVNFKQIMINILPGGMKPPPGISFGITSDQDDMANRLGLALLQSGVINRPIPSYRLPGTGNFHIYIGASTP